MKRLLAHGDILVWEKGAFTCIRNGYLGIGLMNLRYNGLGGINLICAGLLAYAYGRVQGKRDELMRERQLHE